MSCRQKTRRVRIPTVNPQPSLRETDESRLRAKGACMKVVITVCILAVGAWWLYKVGKREGSRKGYHVGRTHRSYRRRR